MEKRTAWLPERRAQRFARTRLLRNKAAVASLIVLGLLVFLALAGSVMVSYLRARAEALDVECRIGVMTRPERVATLAAGLIIVREAGGLAEAIVPGADILEKGGVIAANPTIFDGFAKAIRG